MPFVVMGSIGLHSSSLMSFDSELGGGSVTLAGLAVLEGKPEEVTEPSPFRARLRLATAFASLSVRRSWALVVEDCREGPCSCQPGAPENGLKDEHHTISSYSRRIRCHGISLVWLFPVSSVLRRRR